MSGFPLASHGAQFNWESSERLSGTLLGIVSLRDGKQEVLSTNSQPFLGEGCSWALIPSILGLPCKSLGSLRHYRKFSCRETEEFVGMLRCSAGDLQGMLRECGLQAATVSLLITAT